MATTEFTPSVSSVTRPTFAALLERAVREPGLLHDAYRAFHNFSPANQMLAAVQCAERELPLGPLASFNAWKRKGRHVKRGEKAIWLWQPIICKRAKETDDGSDGEPESETFTRFIYRPRWFVLAQTEGADVEPTATPGWDKARAFAALGIAEVPFTLLDGNTLGFARGRSVAINPVNPIPHKTTFHEVAHVLLGHTATDTTTSDGADLPRSLREAEAESVALLCCESLGLPGAEYARGYIQRWLAGDRIPESSAVRIFKAADAILRAGRLEPDADETLDTD